MDGQPDVPYGANIFTSGGHYGATAYDAPGGEYLELLICTPCLRIMKANSAIHRVLLGTEATPGTWNLWESEEDPREDNPWNRQRLRNEFAMEDFFESADGMNEAWAHRIFDACTTASREGKSIDPASIPVPAGEPTPDNDPRIIAAAQAMVDFYDALRGHPSEWTEIEYAQASASLNAADAWDASNGFRRISVDGLRDQLAGAIQAGDPPASGRRILEAVLSALTTNTGGKGDRL